MAVYTKEYESQPEAILTNVIICPAVDLSANVAVPVHCQVENVLWDTGATNTLISQEVVNALGLQPKNKALISSAGGDVESWTYLVHVILPTGTAELNVQALLNDNSDYDVVIGMEALAASARPDAEEVGVVGHLDLAFLAGDVDADR